MNISNHTDRENSDQEYLTYTDIQLDEIATRAAMLRKEIEELQAENKTWERLYNDLFRMINIVGSK